MAIRLSLVVEKRFMATCKSPHKSDTVKPACSVSLIQCQPAYSATFFCPDPLTPGAIYPILCHPGYSVDFACPDGGTLSGLHCIQILSTSVHQDILFEYERTLIKLL